MPRCRVAYDTPPPPRLLTSSMSPPCRAQRHVTAGSRRPAGAHGSSVREVRLKSKSREGRAATLSPASLPLMRDDDARERYYAVAVTQAHVYAPLGAMNAAYAARAFCACHATRLPPRFTFTRYKMLLRLEERERCCRCYHYEIDRDTD